MLQIVRAGLAPERRAGGRPSGSRGRGFCGSALQSSRPVTPLKKGFSSGAPGGPPGRPSCEMFIIFAETAFRSPESSSAPAPRRNGRIRPARRAPMSPQRKGRFVLRRKRRPRTLGHGGVRLGHGPARRQRSFHWARLSECRRAPEGDTSRLSAVHVAQVLNARRQGRGSSVLISSRAM